MSRFGDWLYKQAVRRGVNESLVTQTLEKADNRGGTLRVLPTVLSTLQSQLQANQRSDPSMGAPFTSRDPQSANWSTVAQMGPGQPATPFPLGGEPRQWVYRVGWNFPTPPDSDRRIDGQLLRELADSTFLIRRAIEIRKAEISAMDWDIVPSAEALQKPEYGSNQRERQKEIEKKHGDKIRKLRKFFKYPEGYYASFDGGETYFRKGEVDWKDWLNAVIEDYYVGDWVTIWPQKTLGGELLALRRVDGEHTKVLLGLDGRLPPPPLPAYQQYLYGVPRANFTQNDLYFWPRNLRNITPYGFSHVEQCLILILLLLRYDQFNLSMYNESTLPMGILETPEGMSPDQIQSVADFLNGAVSTVADKARVYPAPFGTKWQPIKPFTYDKNFANYVIDLACVAMDVTRQEMGFAPSNSEGLGGEGHANAQEALEKRKGTIPLAKWVESKMNRVIEDWFGTDEIEFRFTDLISEDLNDKYTANEVAIRSGQISVDQVLEDLGNDGIGMGHFIQTPVGVFFPEQNVVWTTNGPMPMFGSNGQVPPGATPGLTGDPKQDSQTTAVHEAAKQQVTAQKDVSPTSTQIADVIQATEDERRKREEEWIAGWLALLREKRKKIKNDRFTSASEVRRAFLFDDQESIDFTGQLTTYRLDAYLYTMDRLPETNWHGRLQVPPNEGISRLIDASTQHAQGIMDTWKSDLDTVADRLEADGLDVDQLKDALIDWVKDREIWKGKQIGTTEWTDAAGTAEQVWADNNQAQSIGLMRWVAEIDDHTCEDCKQLNGKLVDANVHKPPHHPNCRCRLEPIGR